MPDFLQHTKQEALSRIMSFYRKYEQLVKDINLFHGIAPETASKIIAGAGYAIAFTGAGMSAESGIPTFRDPGGVCDRFDPSEIGTAEGTVQLAMRYPERIREFLSESLATFE